MTPAGAARRRWWPARGRGAGSAPAPAPPAALLELARRGPAPLAEGPGASGGGALEVAAVIPSFRRGSGGHATIVALMQGLRERGHSISLWLEDCEGRHRDEDEQTIRRSFERFFAADGLAPERDFERWRGADVVLATGWQTAARVLMLPDSGARAYLVQDHEPDFYGASAESLWAAESYRQGLHCLAASEWLAALLGERYGASATPFDLGVDHDLYWPRGAARREDLVVFYARAVTPRRAVPLGLLALKELARRRPEVEIALYGEDHPLDAGFPCRQLGVIAGEELSELYGRATVGMVLSLTNPSLVGLEMMACGLPCVELASGSMLASFGRGGPLALAEADPLGLCEAIERLLDSPEERARRAAEGLGLLGGRTWASAAEQVEGGLRAALG